MRPFALLFLLCCSCGVSEIQGPADAFVVARGADGTYGLQRRTLVADSLTQLRGPLTEMTARPRLKIELLNPTGDMTQDVRMEGGGPMDLRLVQQDGAYMAQDYEGLIALTLYHHLGQSHAYFQNLGLGSAVPDVPKLPTYYLPTIDLLFGLGLPLINDNAGYAPVLSGFLIFDKSLLNELPLTANEGVITHEFGHAVFHHLSGRLRGKNLPEWSTGTWPNAATNFLRSIDEGLADVHAAAMTGDPNFLIHSYEELAPQRDLSQARTFTEELEASVAGEITAYNPYLLGSVLASTFWSYAMKLEQGGQSRASALETMGRRAFEAVRTLEVDTTFHIADLLQNAALSATEGADRTAFCNAVKESFQRVLSKVPECSP